MNDLVKGYACSADARSVAIRDGRLYREVCRLGIPGGSWQQGRNTPNVGIVVSLVSYFVQWRHPSAEYYTFCAGNA